MWTKEIQQLIGMSTDYIAKDKTKIDPHMGEEKEKVPWEAYER